MKKILIGISIIILIICVIVTMYPYKLTEREEFCNFHTYVFTGNNTNEINATYDKLGTLSCCYNGKDNKLKFRCDSILHIIEKEHPDMVKALSEKLEVVN